MKKLITLIFITITITSFGQRLNTETICSADTVYIDTLLGHHVMKSDKIDTTNIIKLIPCKKTTPFALGFGWGITRIFYNQPTKDWIGNHGLWNILNLNITYNKWNAGIKFKTWTVSPQKELDFENKTLPLNASINPNKVDCFLGYSLDLSYGISFEPYIGFNRSTFYVVNQEELNQDFSMGRAEGFLFGLTMHKYFKIRYNEFFSIFCSVNHALTDYTEIHQDLGASYTDFTIGLMYKGFFKRKFYREVD